MLLAPILGFARLGHFGLFHLLPGTVSDEAARNGVRIQLQHRSIPCGVCAFVLGTLKNSLGGYAEAASVVSFVILLGFVGLWIGPETKDRPLPEDADFDVALPDGALAIAK